jgi:hypothetical protein
MRPGHGWGDDWALYVAHAKNTVERRPYSETGYIYNVEARYAPPKYPPGFPILLAPVYAVRGIDLEALKVPGIISFIGALGLLAIVAAGWCGASSALIATSLVAFHPFFRDFKNNILSDLPFLFFLLLGIWISERVLDPRRSDRAAIWWGATAALTWFFAYSIRTVGFALPAAFLVTAVFQKSPARRVIPSLGIFVLLALLQAVIFQGPADYLLQYSFQPDLIIGQLREYIADMRTLVDPGWGQQFARMEFWALSAFAVVGAVRIWKSGHRLPIAFSVVYGATVVLWPFHEGVRMLIPLIPFYFLACVVGLAVAAAKTRRWSFVVLGLACVPIVGAYWRGYHRVETVYEEERIESASARSLFHTVRTSTPDTAVLIFKKPRALALLTGRRSAIYALRSLDDPWRFPRSIRATHFIRVRGSTQDSLYVNALERSSPNAVMPLFANDQFVIYKLDIGRVRAR